MQYKIWTIAVAVLAVAGIGAGAYFLNDVGAVALVNGEPITQEAYDERFSQTEAALKINGVDTSTAESREGISKQVVDTLINEKLLMQKAEDDGLLATEAEIAGAVSETRSQFGAEEEYQAALLTEGFTEESFALFAGVQITAQKVLEKNLSLSVIVVSEEEMEDYYKRSIEGSEVFPGLEEVRTQIESMALQEKRQEAVSAFIANLRNESDIEIFL